MSIDKEYAATETKRALHYVTVFVKWLLLSLVTAVVCGGAGCLFHLLIEKATGLREENNFILPQGI